MKKEAIIAVILGIIFGSIFGFILIVKNKEQHLEKNKTITPLKKEKEIKQTANNLKITQLIISEPDDKTIVYKDKIVIKGSFAKNSLIIIQSPIKDLVFKNNQEQFSTEFPLALGENVIRITVYPQDKQLRSQEKEIRVYYFNNQL